MITANINYTAAGNVPVNFWVLQGIVFPEMKKADNAPRALPGKAVVRLAGFYSKEAYEAGHNPIANANPSIDLANAPADVRGLVLAALQANKDFKDLTIELL